MVSVSEFKSEDPRFKPLSGQGETVFLSLRVNSCTDLFAPDPPPLHMYGTHPNVYTRYRSHIHLSQKSRSHSQCFGHTKIPYTRPVNNYGWVVRLSQLAFLREKRPEFPWEIYPLGHQSIKKKKCLNYELLFP